MPSLTQEQITQARETDLLDYLLSHESGVLKREGANYRHREHDSLVYVASKNYWYWNSRGRKINAVDYLMEIRGYSFVDAVERLAGCGTPAVSHYTASGSREQRKPVEKKPFRLPWVKRCATFAVSYLQRRGVHSDIIRRCMQLGLFYESRYNNEAVCVFVGRDDTGTGRFACVRGIAGDLKKDISGSDKRFSFCYPPDQPGSRHLAVFEAPIDALSHATLQKLEGWQWNGYRPLVAFLERHPEITRVALYLDNDLAGRVNARKIKALLGGTSHVALVAFLERHPEITRVALYLDNDLAGRINARKIKSLLKSDQRFSKIRVSVNPPRSVKDYNEKLQRTLQEIREEKHASRQKQAAVSI